jgi:hypothetical protein
MKIVYKCLFLPLLILLLTACGSSDAAETPELVLPTAVVVEQATPPPDPTLALAPTATFAATAVLFPDTPTPPPAATSAAATTPTALPPTLIPAESVLVNNTRPFFQQDLLFIGNGALRRWSHRDGTVTDLLFPQVAGRQDLTYGNVTQFSVSDNGSRAIAARALPDDPNVTNLFRIGLNNNSSQQIASDIPALLDLVISPDGRNALYISGEIEEDGLPQSGTVYRLNLDEGGAATAVGTCSDIPPAETDDLFNTPCQGGSWTPDSQNMLWSDAQGIWLRHLNATAPTLILPAEYNTGSSSDVTLYVLRDWAKDGRHIMLTLGHYEGSETAVFDVATNQLTVLPNSLFYGSTGYIQSDWMQDDRILVFRQQNEQGSAAPTLELWRLNDTQFTREESIPLDLPPHNWLQDPIHFITGRLAFTLLADDPAISGIYLMASGNEPPEKVNSLPYRTGRTTWVYDNNGTLFAMPGQDDAFLFLSTDPEQEQRFYDIRSFTGDHASDFYWLPPS